MRSQFLVLERLAGGSILSSPIIKTPNILVLLQQSVIRDNYQYSPNENRLMGNYREGIRTMLAILTQKL